MPGRAERITSNWALIAFTAGSSGRRCSASTPSSAPERVARPSEIAGEAAADQDQRDREHRDHDEAKQDAEHDVGVRAHAGTSSWASASPNPSVSAFM